MNQHKSLSTIINKLQRKELLLHMEYNYEKENFQATNRSDGHRPQSENVACAGILSAQEEAITTL